MSIIIQRDTQYYSQSFTKNPIILEANNYLIYPFKFSGDWNEIRIGIECYIADAHNYTGLPIIELLDGNPTDDRNNFFYFGIKRNDNPNDFMPINSTGNAFIGYLSSNYLNDIGQEDFVSCCVPIVDNSDNICATGNIAPVISDCYRVASADTGYFYTLKDENCNPTTTCNRNFRFITKRFVEATGSINSSISEFLSISNQFNEGGFLGMASGVPTLGSYISRNGITFNIYNRDQTGQIINMSLFNNTYTNPNANSPQINLLRDFILAPYYYYTDNNYFTLDFTASGSPSLIPDNLFIYWPFKKNVLAITDIVIEKFA